MNEVAPRVPDDIRPARIAICLDAVAESEPDDMRFGRSVDVRSITDSTMDDARSVAADAAHGHLVLADAQRAGRGSRGAAWSSEPGTDLYLSIVAKLPLAPSDLPPITLAVGLGVAEAVERTTNRPTKTKWPNDVWLEGEKCAGVLVETVMSGGRIDAAVVGIGLNVNRSAFPPGLAATSLRRATGYLHDRAQVLATLLAHVERRVNQFQRHGPAAIVEALSPRLALRGERIRIDQLTGVLEGVAPDGALLVRVAGRLTPVRAGRLERA